jgi:phosphopantetheinyl transferase
VHPTNGLKIQINALALERKSADAPQKVKVTISTEKSQFQTEHFSATFLLDGAENFEKETQGLPAYAQERLEIDAKKDLYSWLLFQGPLFQRLSDFYQIDNDMMVFDSLTEEGEEKHWMLGSPYVRDSLLQSVQPMVPEHGCLPVFIDSISIADTSMALPKKIRGVSFNEELVEKEYRTSVYGLSDERVVYEKLEGYRLQIIDYRQEFPTDIPAIKTELYEEEELSDDINILAQYLNGINSNVTIQYVPTLSKMSREERHKVIKPMAEAWLKREGIESQLNWDGENKPILDGNKHILSISHSKSYLLMQVTDENAGCDIEHILHRSSEMWSKILTLKSKNYQDMMDRFQEGGESEDMAGTRLWSIRESIYKAIGEFTGEISINFIEDGVALIKAKDERYSLELLSLPIETRNGAECMVTFTIKRGSDESYKSR